MKKKVFVYTRYIFYLKISCPFTTWAIMTRYKFIFPNIRMSYVVRKDSGVLSCYLPAV